MPKIDYTMFQGSFNEELHEVSKLKGQLKIVMAMQTKERHKLEFKENQTKNAKRGLFYLFIHSRNIY